MQKSNKLNGKDLINVGIYTAMTLVIFFVFGLLTSLPVIYPFLLFIWPFVCGIPMMLYYTKIQKFGMLTITGVICGLFFFLMIVGGQILEPIGKWCIEKMHIPTQSFGWKLWQRIRTFVLFSASISFSWSASMKDGFRMWARCFKPTNLSSLLPLASRADWFLLVIGAVIVWLISYGKQKEDVRMYVAKKALPVRWILYLVLLFAVLICGVYGPGYDASSFIYGQF